MDSSLTTITLIILCVVLLSQLGFIYYLLSQRKFKIKNVDVELESFLNQLFDASTKSNHDVTNLINLFGNNLDKYDETNLKTKEALDKFVGHIINNIDGMKEDINSVKELALQKEEKIKRYEEGYDKKTFNQFIKELFRILDFIKDEQNKEFSNNLKEIEEDLVLLLEDNGINKTDIQKGQSSEDLTKLAKVIRAEKTNIEEENYIVKEVLKDGYFIQLDEENIHVIKHAEVIINKYEGNE